MSEYTGLAPIPLHPHPRHSRRRQTFHLGFLVRRCQPPEEKYEIVLVVLVLSGGTSNFTTAQIVPGRGRPKPPSRAERPSSTRSSVAGSVRTARVASETNIALAGAGLLPFEPFMFGSRKSVKSAAARRQTTPDSTPAAVAKNAGMYPDVDGGKQSSRQMTAGSSFSRTESVSSTSVRTALSTRTVTSTDPSAAGGEGAGGSGGGGGDRPKPYVQRNGRTYINDASVPYPLPVDLAELHRQILRTLLLMQVHGAPLASPAVAAKPPLRVLEVGCGTGFWSMMCHRYFKGRGHSGMSFTGLDIVPLSESGCHSSVETGNANNRPDADMDWTYVQHDVRNLPWPFADGEFDLVFWKDMSLVVSPIMQGAYIEETVRLLESGGTLEIWETDHTIRMLRPHVPSPSAIGSQASEHEKAASLGAYMININTPLSAPLNTYLVEYNAWISRALKARDLIANPCTMMNHHLLQESESVGGFGSHRVAVPLSEVRWEREGVGGVVTKDGKSYVKASASGLPARSATPTPAHVDSKALTAGQAALRRTALITLVDQIVALEPILRDASGKSQDEWDMWLGKMMTDIVNEGGTNWGECLESGAWWAKKK
ncbi:Methyltransferase domain [Geosmithia morbida]|uniref:Methyltransferase domain n=1 Tax=Geosmithia morbida TaxID=1094350 RepID=A0A9P5D3K4_9HYPO|nr:Methyltransferase domain [Geosmithia morbida]KAF4121880.1 Methyltransferase domain [Geosmithia morbida]